MGFQVKAWLRRKTVMLGSEGWQEREGEICAIASSRVARRGAARTQASKPALAVPPSDQGRVGQARRVTAWGSASWPSCTRLTSSSPLIAGLILLRGATFPLGILQGGTYCQSTSNTGQSGFG